MQSRCNVRALPDPLQVKQILSECDLLRRKQREVLQIINVVDIAFMPDDDIATQQVNQLLLQLCPNINIVDV